LFDVKAAENFEIENRMRCGLRSAGENLLLDENSHSLIKFMWRLSPEFCALVYVSENAPEKFENKSGAKHCE